MKRELKDMFQVLQFKDFGDERGNLVVIEGLLKTTEVKLDTASGGEEALRLTKDTTYDLILLDQRMPHMSGTEVLERIRAQDGPDVGKLRGDVEGVAAAARLPERHQFVGAGRDRRVVRRRCKLRRLPDGRGHEPGGKPASEGEAKAPAGLRGGHHDEEMRQGIRASAVSPRPLRQPVRDRLDGLARRI